MDDLMNNGTIPFIVFGLLAVVAIWQLGAHWRAKALVSHEADYRALADRAVRAQEVAEQRLANVSDQVAEVTQRLSKMEVILKEVE